MIDPTVEPEGPVPGLGADRFRLPLMGEPGTPLGATPRATPEVQQEFNQYVERTVDPENTFDLVVHRPRLLVFKQPPVRIQIADDKVANYLLITDREFSITGSAIGSTVLNIWFAAPGTPSGQKVLSYLVRVLPDPEAKLRLEAVYKALQDEINQNFPNSNVELSLVGDKVVVRGEAKDIVEASQIIQVVGANAPGRNRQGANQAGLNSSQLANVPLNQTGFFGNAESVADAQVISANNAVYNQVLNTNANIINLLRVPGEQQVMLRVSVAEVSRSAARSIGMNMDFRYGNGFSVFQQLAGAATVGTGNLPTMLDNGQISLAIQALRDLSLARSLAEPNLVTTNGQRATFHAGGSFPITTSLGNVTTVAQTVQYVPLGVQVFFIPYITDRDRIRLVISAQVSTRSDASTVAGGTSVPSNIDQRSFFSTVELREGQTLAVAGLIQNNFGATSERVPLFGDLPIIGTLMGARTTTSAEQELVMLITPELIHPNQACATPPLPGADIFEPGDLEFYLYNRLESRRNYDFRASVRTDWARMRRYERCEDEFIVGVQGRTYGCCDPYCGKGPQPAAAAVDETPGEPVNPGAVSPAPPTTLPAPPASAGPALQP